MNYWLLNFLEYNLYWPENNTLVSTIPTELGNLELLEVLILGKFSMKANLGNTLMHWSKRNLQSYQYCKKGANKMSGSLPSELGKISSLKYLDLRE